MSGRVDEADLRLIELVARQMERRIGFRVPCSELQDLALPGLLLARKEWDGRGNANAYAMERARWAMIDGLRKRSRDALTMALSATELAADRCSRTAQDAYDAPDPALAAEEAIDDLIDTAAVNLAVDFAAATTTELDADRIRLRRAITELPPPMDQILERHLYRGQTFAQVATELQLPLASVHDLHGRGVRQLTRQLGPSGRPSQRQPPVTSPPAREGRDL